MLSFYLATIQLETIDQLEAEIINLTTYKYHAKEKRISETETKKPNKPQQEEGTQ